MIQPGVVLKGQYRIDALIGGGGMALVYRAFDLNLQRVCAIKQNLDTSPEAQRQFHLEAILLANLSHPHLSRVTDHFVDTTGQQYLVMDFVEGEDLDAYVRRTGPMTERQALAWMSGIFDALSYCHGQGVIHRDVKPANLVKRRGEDTVVLVDFGIAKSQAGGMTLAGAQAASPAYAPLEQFVGHTDPRSDVYALGATLYYLLTGHEPPDARLVASGVEQITPPRALNPAISPRTEQSVLHALALRVADRPQSVAALAAALASHPPQPPGPTVRPTRPPARRASSIALAAVALLGVLAVMLFALNRLGGNGGGVAATATVAIVAALPSPETTTPATAASMQPTETATLSAATVSPSGAATDTPTAGRSPTSTPAATDTLNAATDQYTASGAAAASRTAAAAAGLKLSAASDGPRGRIGAAWDCDAAMGLRSWFTAGSDFPGRSADGTQPAS
ncbi:MAG: protein kinase [Anaerolineae bacterium]